MGRQPWTSRLTTEQCPCLNVTDMRRVGVFRSVPGSRWLLKHQSGIPGAESNVNYTVVEAPGCAMGLRFDCGLAGQYIIEVTTTRPRFGGRRYWLRCPLRALRRDGTRCGRRVGRLYLPPGQQVFGCRLCYWLTYASCQQHDARRDALLRNPPALLLAVQSTNRPRRLLALGALQSLQKS